VKNAMDAIEGEETAITGNEVEGFITNNEEALRKRLADLERDNEILFKDNRALWAQNR